jgi:DNA replication protein DnaC
MTSTEESEARNQFQIRSDQAIAEGWRYNEDPPEPKKCEYCGKTLYHYGLINPLQTKQIFIWMPEPEHCDCERAQRYWAKVEADKKAAEEEKRRREEQERLQQKINKLIKDSGIRGRFLNRTFERFEVNEVNRQAYEVAKNYADNFRAMLPKKGPNGIVQPPEIERNGLFITGSYGTGKTHLAAAISNQLIREGIPVICMTMIDLLARIKQTFDRSDEATEAEIMKIYEEVPLLVIDDIGSEQPSEWGTTKIFAIINARYEAYMPTIVTTNYAGDDLIRRMTPIGPNGRPLDSRNAEKTLDRLYEMCVGIEMNWESWRSRA